jgi:plasmid stability protein
MEEEARDILRSALAMGKESRGLFKSIRTRIEAAGGGVDLALPEREPMRDPIDFDQ